MKIKQKHFSPTMAHHSSVILSYWLTSPEIKQNVWKISTASIFLTPSKSQFEINTYFIEIVIFCFCFCYFPSCADLIWFCRNKAQHCYNIWMALAPCWYWMLAPVEALVQALLVWNESVFLLSFSEHSTLKSNGTVDFSVLTHKHVSQMYTHISWTNLLFVNIF